MSRVYQSGKAENRYKSADKSRGFAPVNATSSSTQLQQYTAAIDADARTMGRELTRQQQAETTALQAQQTATSAQAKANQGRETAELTMDQSFETGTFNLWKQHEELTMGLERSHMDASNTVANAKFNAVKGAVNGLLDFGGSVVKYGAEMSKIREKEEAEAYKQKKADSIYNAFTGGIGQTSSGPTETQVNSDLREDVTGANAEAVLRQADPMLQSDDPAEVNAGIDLSQSTIWATTANVAGEPYAARAMYPTALQQAIDENLIRPSSQGGMQDLQRFNRRFLEATGLLGPGADTQLIADVFMPQAMADSANAMRSLDANHQKAVIAANKVEITSRISETAAGTSVASVRSDFDRLNLDGARTQLNMATGGKPNAASVAFVLGEYLNNLAAEGKTDEIRALAGHAANPATPNITLGSKYHRTFREAEKNSLQGTIQRNTTRHLEAKLEGEKLESEYLRDPTNVKARDAYAGWLARPGASAADLKNLDNMRQPPNAKWDETISTRLDEQIKAGDLPTESDLIRLKRDGMPDKQYTYFKQFTREKLVDGPVTEATSNLSTTIKDSMLQGQNRADLSPETLAGLNIRVDAAEAIIMERLSAVVAADPSLRKDTTRLAAVVDSVVNSVTDNPEFKIAGELDPNKYAIEFQGPLVNTKVPRTASGVDNFAVMRPDQIFSGNIPRAQMNISVDKFSNKSDIIADADKLLAREDTSNRTRLIAKNLGLTPRAFIDAQLQANGMEGGLSSYRLLKDTGSTLPQGAPDASLPPIPSNEELRKMYRRETPETHGEPNTISGNGKRRTIQVGRALLDEGYVMWQHPNFDADRGYVADGSARVGKHTTNSAHYHGEALDFPIGDNGEARLDALYAKLMRNKEKWGIRNIIWRAPGHHHHLHVDFYQ